MSEEQTDQTEQTQEPEMSLREQLEHEFTTQGEEGAEEDEETTAKEEPEVEAEEVEEEVTEEDEGGSEEEVKEEGGDEEPAEDVALEAPEHWAADDKETFGKQSEEVKSYLLKRHNEMESGFTQKTQDLAEQRKSVDALNQFMNKWEPHTSAMGIPLVTGLEALLNHDRQLRSGTAEQKTQLLLQLAQQYGININATPPTEDEYTDPQLTQLQDQVNTLSGNLQARDQLDQKNAADRQQTAVNEAQSAVDTFKEVKDEKGNLKYPHFEALKTEILGLVQSGQTGTGDFNAQLETAYDKALWMNSDTREQLLASKQSSLKEEDLKKQSKAAAQAKKSAKANKKGTNAKAEKPKALVSLRDDIAEQVQQAMDA